MGTVISMADFKNRRLDKDGTAWVDEILVGMEERNADPLLMEATEAGFAAIEEKFKRTVYAQVLSIAHEGCDEDEEERLMVVYPTREDMGIPILTITRHMSRLHAICDQTDAVMERRCKQARDTVHAYIQESGDPTINGVWSLYVAFIDGAVNYLLETVDVLASDMSVEDGVFAFAVRSEDSVYNLTADFGKIIGFGTGTMTLPDASEKTADR